MKRILLYYKKNGIDRRIFPATDYHTLWKEYGDIPGNPGNKLFIQACEQYLTKPDIEFEYFSENMSPEYINKSFDLVLLPTANIFNRSETVIKWLKEHTCAFQKYKIPVIVLGAGAQTDSYDDLLELSNSIKEPAKEFIESVYRTGGQFGLRGYFTQRLFELWGYKQAVVTGCPSLYQNGRNLNIKKNTVRYEDFVPSINGEVPLLVNKWWKRQFRLFKKSVFVDQGIFYHLFYNAPFLEKNKLSLKKANELAHRFTDFGLELIHQNRVRLFYDILAWSRFFAEEHISFSTGQRIHGNIIAILNEVPAVVCVHDSRTQELAEYFDIPVCKKPEEKSNIYEIYQESDFSAFNRNFASKFDQFEKFLCEYGISYNIADKQLFEKKWEKENVMKPECIDPDYLERLYKLRKRGKWAEKIIK